MKIEDAVTTCPLSFVALGDCGWADAHRERIGRQIGLLHQNHPVSAILLLGDNIQDDGPFEPALARRFTSPLKNLVDARIPFYAVLGNHDYRRSWIRNGELKLPLFHMDGLPYYQKTFALGKGSITFFMLLAETIPADGDQIKWFRDALAKNRSDWKILILHRPMVASAQVGHGPSKKIFRALGPILKNPGGIDMVLAGHNHVYERRKPVDGVLHITLGNGGDLDHHAVFPPDPERVIGYNARSCFGVIQGDAKSLSFQVTNEDGQVIDRIRLEKRGETGKTTITELAR